MIETLLLFSAVALVAIVTPGPTVLLALSNGSRFGVRASLPGMLGAVTNPKGYPFVSAVLPQFIDTALPLRARGRLWLDRLCGGTLLALAASLALYRRPGAA